MNYKVFKDREQLEVKSCRIYPKPYNSNEVMEYVMFDINNRTELVIESETEIKSVVIRPLSAAIPFEIRSGKIAVTLDRPVKISVEINGRCENNLMVFAHKPQCLPQRTQNYIEIKKGEDYNGTLFIDKDDTTVYIEEGASLYGNIIAEGCSNINICGYGRICMESYTYEMRKDFARSIDIRGCKNVTVNDIIIDDSNDWSLRITGCDGVQISNIKIFGCRGNSDGIDVCGSRNVTVSDIFTRVWDDSFVVKALDTGNSENILFKDSVLWNDFARPIEVGVELRADKVRNVRFENIDVIHSVTGYPLMGIHHGDRAEVSDIVFDNIRIEDAAGAQLFDIRIADSVWSRDTRMGNIHDITFSNINYIGADDSSVMLSNSRIEGFSDKHDIKNVRFHNIRIRGRAVKTVKELGLDVYEYTEGVSVTSDEDLPEASVLSADIELKKAFELNSSGRYVGTVAVKLSNNNTELKKGTAVLAVSPKNIDSEIKFAYELESGGSNEYEFEFELQAGKYVFYLKNDKNEIENKFLLVELELPVQAQKDIKNSPKLGFINYYNMCGEGVRIAVSDNELIIMNEFKDRTDFVLYTAMPADMTEGEVLFSAEETDFGEIYALINKSGKIVPAPQLRCPAEITYVFRNEPKVKEIITTYLTLESGGVMRIPFEQLGIDINAESFLMELAAKTEETDSLRYPYTLFHSTMPEKTAHMYGKVKIIR